MLGFSAEGSGVVYDEHIITDVVHDFRERFNFWILRVWEVVHRKVEVCHGCCGQLADVICG